MHWHSFSPLSMIDTAVDKGYHHDDDSIEASND
jgi:hypothetical protein